MTETKYTLGWIMTEYKEGYCWVGPDGEHPSEKTAAKVYRPERNACLIVAACNSYAKHCGDRAVECAESDLLGELLKALKTLVQESNDVFVEGCDCSYCKAVNTARAAIARTTGGSDD